MTDAAHLAALGRAHGFTLEELRANLRGELHPRQVARGGRKGLVAAFVLGVLGLAALGGGVLGAEAFREGLGAAPGNADLNAVLAIRWTGVLAGLGFLAGGASALARRRRRRAAFAQGRPEVLVGPLDKIFIEGRGIPSRWIFRVRGRGFDASRTLWALLTQGATYRLHLVDDQLLSFAPVDPDAHERAGFEREAAQFERTRGIVASKRVR